MCGHSYHFLQLILAKALWRKYSSCALLTDRETRIREVEGHARVCIAIKRRGWDSNPGRLAPELVIVSLLHLRDARGQAEGQEDLYSHFLTKWARLRCSLCPSPPQSPCSTISRSSVNLTMYSPLERLVS